ncbi:MAG: chemotaxis protein CheW [Kofleriaceae bacterium]
MLIAKVGALTCAIPIAHVVETMRPLPVEPLGRGGAAYVRGVAIIRGAPTVVIDTAMLLATTSAGTRRFVIVRTADREVALMVDEVIDIRSLGELGNLPPLVASASGETIRAIGAIDAGLIVVLEAARLVPAIDGAEAPA